MAIPVWAGRVSPVFDVARHLLVVDVADGRETARNEETLDEATFAQRTRHMTDLGVDVLICGAISGPLEMMLASAGLRVIPHTCGPVEDVLGAFIAGGLTEQTFLMPGCRGRRRRFRRGGRGGRFGFNRIGDTP
ncbi:MAG: NifB/NifX family molybdenum-iron cluster-binding protein [Planctomycetota bacterium]|nr:NifB/NifX family molybdenum-iron cluster-binding protein [Planctomycetota bacterium]